MKPKTLDIFQDFAFLIFLVCPFFHFLSFLKKNVIFVIFSCFFIFAFLPFFLVFMFMFSPLFSCFIHGFALAVKVSLVLYCLEQAHSFTLVVLGLWRAGENNVNRFEKADVFVSE